MDDNQETTANAETVQAEQSNIPILVEPESVRLQSKDGVIFTVKIKVARCSKQIEEAMNFLGMIDNKYHELEENIIRAPQVEATILGKIIQWAEHHQDDSSVTDNSFPDYELSEWDTQFFDAEDQLTLVAIIRAAHFLRIQRLMVMTCNVAYEREIKSEIPQEEITTLVAHFLTQGLENMEQGEPRSSRGRNSI